MIRIWQKQKLILTLSIVAFLISVFFTSKSVPVAYGVSVGGLIYSPEGYFIADNSVFGGPGDSSGYSSGLGDYYNRYGQKNLHAEPGCGNCLDGYWYKWRCATHRIYCCSKSGCWVCRTIPIYCYDWKCILTRLGSQGNYTADSACKAAYGGGVTARITYLRNTNTQIEVCDFTASKVYMVECIAPPASAPVIPPAPAPPCLEWKDGACVKVNTSLQGGDNGDISTEPAQFIVRILAIILSFAGGIALLLIISAGYKIITSKGKPEAIQQGRDQLISAIVGLVFIIFSFVIFQLIVADILKIPGITK